MSNETTLALCPFCGGEARHYALGPIDHHIECTNPKCYAVTAGWSTEAEAVAAWNRRADYHGYEQAAIEAWKSIKTWNTRTAHGTLTAEQVREAIFNGSVYASYDGSQYYASGIGMQAIADELNELGSGTCKVESTLWHDHGGYDSDTYEFVLSCGHTVEWLDSEPPRHCPECGKAVM